ncbi:MAG: hypothetical protein GY838_12960 [bacterium]|nr:hypothetical protein [bacterium]
MREPLIIHHVGCADGICGAMVLWFGLGRKGELLPAQYGDAPPSDEDIIDRDVWIVDFSYPRDALVRLDALAHDLHVLDHHRTAAANCEGLDFCVFDETRSGAKIAFDLMLGLGALQHEPPQLVDLLAILVSYVQDRDLWRWEMDRSREISAWLASWPRNLITWVQLLARIAEAGLPAVATEGQAILRNNDILVASMARQAETVQWIPPEGPAREVLLVNGPVLHSELASKLLEKSDCAFVCVWRRTRDGYVYNLRSTTADVSEVAKTYGGGGHAQAAGFSSPSRPAWFFIQPEKDPE